MIDRRLFLQSLMVAAASPALAAGSRSGDMLVPDPGEILDLADGFSYRVISRAGEPMSDGLTVPPAHDGMAAFPGKSGRVVLVCNHEMPPSFPEYSAFGTGFDKLPDAVKERVYDHGGGTSPGAGGTTTTIYNPATGETERQFLSLAGTELNCAGGPTPWGSWLSCEECFENPGTAFSGARLVTRDERHGYVFEVPADSDGLVDPVPIRAMGRFEHEACAVHEASGIVYMTEDRHYSLFYRYIPDIPGKLHEGGKLQALAIKGKPSMQTHNWSRQPDIDVNREYPVHWIDLDDVNSAENKLRLRGAAAGAATFARGEGLCAAGGAFAFTCTIGGHDRLGQVFSYVPSPAEGQPGEEDRPGTLTLVAESQPESILHNADNLTMSPWGDLILCEDSSDNCGLVGIRPDGSQYRLANNSYSDSELAGVCFAPDGRTLFVNVQYPGKTLAITGPFPT